MRAAAMATATVAALLGPVTRAEAAEQRVLEIPHVSLAERYGWSYPTYAMSPAPPPPPAVAIDTGSGVPADGNFHGWGPYGCYDPHTADIQALIVAEPWDDAAALEIANRESGCNPYAKNTMSSASGVFQLVSTWWAGQFDPYDAAANIAKAYSMWSADGGSFCPGQWCV